MYKGLSHQLHAGLAFAEVHEQVADVVAMHEVADFPTLMVFKVWTAVWGVWGFGSVGRVCEIAAGVQTGR